MLKQRSCWKQHIPVDYVCFEMLSALPAAGALISCPCLQRAACLAQSLLTCPSSASSPCFAVLYPSCETEIEMWMYLFKASREGAFSSLAGCVTFTFSCLSGFSLLKWGLWTAPLKTASSARAETLGMLDNNLLTSFYIVRQCPTYLGHFCCLSVIILHLVSFGLVILTKESLNHLISCTFS